MRVCIAHVSRVFSVFVLWVVSTLLDVRIVCCMVFCLILRLGYCVICVVLVCIVVLCIQCVFSMVRLKSRVAMCVACLSMVCCLYCAVLIHCACIVVLGVVLCLVCVFK